MMQWIQLLETFKWKAIMDNPAFNGDYIAQTKVELDLFEAELNTCLHDKAEGKELKFKRKYNDFAFPFYSFAYVQKYLDEKLASYNPKIYIIDLDEIMENNTRCILKYAKIFNMTNKELNSIIPVGFSFDIDGQYVQPKIVPFNSEIKFCLQLNNYYLKKRKYLNFENLSHPNATDSATQFDLDKEALLNILSETITTLSEDKLLLLCDHILHNKYGNSIQGNMPILALNIKQSKLIEMVDRIREELKLQPSSREYLADLFSKIPKEFIDQKPYYYTRGTIYSKMKGAKLT